MNGRSALIIGIIGVVLTASTVLFGPGIIGRFSRKTLVFNVTQSELALPPGVKLVPSEGAEVVVPNWVASFSFSNETGLSCTEPIFRLTVPGVVSTAVITDTKEKKEVIQASVKYESRHLTEDTVRFESDRVAPGSFISGLIWYKVSGSGGPVEVDLSSENGFVPRELGEEKNSLPEQIWVLLTALLAAFSALTLMLYRRG